MKPTKRAKRKQARQKLKIESETINKEHTLENKVPADTASWQSEVGVLIMAIICSPILIVLMLCSGNKYHDINQRQFANNTPEIILQSQGIEGIDAINTIKPIKEETKNGISNNISAHEYYKILVEKRKILSSPNNLIPIDQNLIAQIAARPYTESEAEKNISDKSTKYLDDKLSPDDVSNIPLSANKELLEMTIKSNRIKTSNIVDEINQFNTNMYIYFQKVKESREKVLLEEQDRKSKANEPWTTKQFVILSILVIFAGILYVRVFGEGEGIERNTPILKISNAKESKYSSKL